MSRQLFVILFAGVLFASPADAHFLFVRILPPAEGGRAAEVYFSELAEAGDSRFIDKIAHTKLLLQTAPGMFRPLTTQQAPDRLRAYLPSNAPAMVVGECVYGVLARPKQTPFLLRHFPKAMSGSIAGLNKLTPYGKLPLEITAKFEKSRITLAALKDGKPTPGAEFITVDSKLNNVKIAADDKGVASWQPPAPGNYSVYTRDTRKQAGEANGKKYEEIRDFATIAFTWPLERDSADPAAVALFEEAVAARAQWTQFPGFKASVSGNLDGRRFDGTVTIDAKGEVLFSDNEPSREESVAWVQEQLESIVLHRMPRGATKSKNVVRFAEDKDDHPLGRLLVFEGGKFASSYRVKDKQLMVVNRQMGKTNMTITILENDKTAGDKYLPRSYVVHYWDAATGRLLRTEAVQSGWVRVGSLDLPAAHRVTTTSDAGVSVRGFTLSKHTLSK